MGRPRERCACERAHPFCLASLTKPFTTTALMGLVGEGRLSLDHNLARYVPANRRRGSVAGFSHATVADLGAHVAGFASTFEMYPVDDGFKPPAFTLLLRHYGAMVFPPGQVYEYSNVGYALLGDIAEQVSGRPFAEVLRRGVLDPVGLERRLLLRRTSAARSPSRTV